MKKAKVESGVVVNVAEFGVPIPDWAADWPDLPEGVGRGWTYDGTNFTAPVLDISAAREGAQMSRQEFAAAAAVAGFVTYTEAANYANGISLPASVEAVIAAQPDPDRIRFEVLTEVTIKRNGTLMPALAVAFSTDDTGIDALFGIL